MQPNPLSFRLTRVLQMTESMPKKWKIIVSLHVVVMIIGLGLLAYNTYEAIQINQVWPIEGFDLIMLSFILLGAAFWVVMFLGFMAVLWSILVLIYYRKKTALPYYRYIKATATIVLSFAGMLIGLLIMSQLIIHIIAYMHSV